MSTADAPVYAWNTLPWKHYEQQVFKLQKRIYQASRPDDRIRYAHCGARRTDTRPERRFVMAVFNGMFPLLPGKEDAARAWIKEAAGPRKEEFDAMQRRSDIARETLTLMTTPMGSFMLVWFDGDIEKAFGEVATGQDEFTAWHRAQLHDVTGIDLSQPEEGPLPELMLDWRA